AVWRPQVNDAAVHDLVARQLHRNAVPAMFAAARFDMRAFLIAVGAVGPGVDLTRIRAPCVCAADGSYAARLMNDIAAAADLDIASISAGLGRSIQRAGIGHMAALAAEIDHAIFF